MALSNIDEIIRLIKDSANAPEAKEKLLSRPWRSSLVEDMLSRTDLDLHMMRLKACQRIWACTAKAIT